MPLLALADRAGLSDLLDERLTVTGRKGVGHDAPADVFTGVKAPSTIGSHLGAYPFGHVRQLSRFLPALGRVCGLPAPWQHPAR